MMKHAILILAHSSYTYLYDLVRMFDNDFYIFIHWDKKYKLQDSEMDKFNQIKNVKYCNSIHSVYWADYSMVEAILLLCREALKYPEIEYLHLISGADVLIKDLRCFKKFFIDNQGDSFLDYFSLPCPYWTDGGLFRLQYYHQTHQYDLKTTEGYTLYQADLDRQKAIGIKRDLPQIPLYGGSTWWSLTKECIAYLVANSTYISKIYAQAFCSDEMFVQTILMNSPYSTTIKNNNLRYVCWEHRNGNLPAILDKSDLKGIVGSSAFFARKIDLNSSKELLRSIHVLRSDTLQIEEAGIFHLEDLLSCLMNYLLNNYNKNELKGLLLGKMGILILFSLYRKYVSSSFIKESIITDLVCNLENEFITTEEYDDESGSIGMAIGWEFLHSTIKISAINSARLDEINHKIHIAILNTMLGNSQKLPTNILMTYFHCRKINGRFTAKDEKSLYLLCRNNSYKKFKYTETALNLREFIKKLNCTHSMGLMGYAGIGMHLLSEMSLLSLDEWYFILLEKKL